MKILAIEQGSEQWHQLRRERVTATDAPICLGLDPWSTPLQRWQQKMGITPQKEITPAMQRGLDLEDKAREVLSERIGVPLMPAVVESDEHPWAMASLDAIDPEMRVMAEIKCPGEESHASAVMGVVPEHYFAQCQHQLMVTALDTMIYWSFDGTDGVQVEVLRDNAFIERMLNAEIHFYRCITDQTPPPLTERDYVRREDQDWNDAVDHWRYCKTCLDDASYEEEEAREKLKALAGDHSCEGYGIKLRKSVEVGRIDYKSIPELQRMDLTKYRKPPIIKWTIHKDKIK